jgi:hypothetical protein
MVTHISSEVVSIANRTAHTPRIVSYHAMILNKRLKADCIPALGGVLSVKIVGLLGEAPVSRNRLIPGEIIDVPVNERQYRNYAQDNQVIVNQMGPVYFL